MKEKYEMIGIEEKEIGPFISFGADAELKKILKPESCAYLGSPDFKELSEKIKSYDLKQIVDYRGKFVLYLKSDGGFVKLSLEPDALEELLGIKVVREAVCKDFKGLAKKVQDILDKKIEETETKETIDRWERAQQIFEREFEEC